MIAHDNPGDGAYYTATEAAAKLGVVRQRIRQLCANGQLNGWKANGEWRVSRQSVHARLAMKPPKRKTDEAGALEEQRRLTHKFAEGNRYLAGELARTQEALEAMRRKHEDTVQRLNECEGELQEERRRSETHRKNAEESAKDVALLEAKVERLGAELRKYAPKGNVLGANQRRLGKGPEGGYTRRRREPPPERRVP